ncbi:MAG: hypothetical protein JXA11_10840 [Phycisphaerae bacterium]|nr:hypothetical protein [Phycisphaerae bacterium]
MLHKLIHHPAVLFYLSDDDRLSEASISRPGDIWIGLLVSAFAWGWVNIGLWHGGRCLFGQPMGMFLLPNLLVVAGLVLVMYRRAAMSLIRILAGRDAALGSLIGCLLTLLLLAGFLVLRPGWHWQEQALPHWLAWIRPESKLDRLLLLMPLWGAWSMLILVQFHRPSEDDALLYALARGCGPFTAAVLMGILLAASIGYFAYLPWTQLTIPAVAILAAVGGGFALAKRNGAMDRSVLLATNLLTQSALLLATAANSNVRQW